MDLLQRITRDPAVMGGRPCIRGMRVTVGTIVGLLATGRSHEDILQAYPYLEPDDIRAALSYAAWRTEEVEQEENGFEALGASLIQVRTQDVLPDAIGTDVVRVLREHHATLDHGAIVSIDELNLRVRVLPTRRR